MTPLIPRLLMLELTSEDEQTIEHLESSLNDLKAEFPYVKKVRLYRRDKSVATSTLGMGAHLVHGLNFDIIFTLADKLTGGVAGAAGGLFLKWIIKKTNKKVRRRKNQKKKGKR